jgi:regulator of ribonuclease activity A
MARDDDIIRTADICDDHGDDVLVCELAFFDYAKRTHFHGQVVTFSTFEDNKGVREVLAEGGAGKVLVVDGQGSRRRALCGGNIAAEAQSHGWEGLVYNGCIRDQHEFTDLDFGVKAIGTTPLRPRTDGIAKVGVPLYFGGIVINDGDYLYADVDGVIVAAKPLHE